MTNVFKSHLNIVVNFIDLFEGVAPLGAQIEEKRYVS